MKLLKYALITLTLLTTISFLEAQELENVTIKYRQIKKIDIKLPEGRQPGQRMKDFLARLPEEADFAFKLEISKNIALYSENLSEQAAPSQEMSRAMHMMERLSPPNASISQVYYNLGKQSMVQQFDLMGRSFIVKSDIGSIPWKLKGEQRKINDYICMSAEMQIGDDLIKAWFTPQLPFSIGPDMFYGLPGVILAVEKNGRTLYVANSIEVNKSEFPELIQPKEGKKISEENLKKLIVEKKEEHKELMKQMPQRRGQFHGGGGGRR